MTDTTENKSAPIITAKMNALAYGGACIGEVTGSSQTDFIGMKVFIGLTIPGETVRARISSQQPRFLEAELIEVQSPSASRVEPPCPYFAVCGGCDLQHISVATQREEKRKMVEATLRVQNKLIPLRGVSLIGGNIPAWNYRRRISLHVSPTGQVGFYKARSGDIVEIGSCAIAENSINQILPEVRSAVAQLGEYIDGLSIEDHNSEVQVLCKLRESAPFPFPNFHLLEKFRSLVVERRAQLLYRREDGSEQSLTPLGHFSQVNSEANSILLTNVLSSISSKGVTELYAGAGNFTIPLAQKGFSVTAIEADPTLVNLGRSLATTLGCADKINFIKSSCEKFAKSNKFAKSVLLDPPRSGAKDVVKFFKPESTTEIVYVSCNLPTLARDIKTLVAKGYQLDQVLVLDMFPQTHHLEMIATIKS